MPRANDISDSRNQKRRRLNNNSSIEVSPYPHAIADLVLEQNEYIDLVATGLDETPVDCESDNEASTGNAGDDRCSECCYGMVGSYINFYNMIFLINFPSYLAFGCGSDIIQISRSPNYPPIFALPFEPQIPFPPIAMGPQSLKYNLPRIRES